MRYPEDYINKILCGDCVDVMRGIPDNFIDLILTDPLYGVSKGRLKMRLGVKKNESWFDTS